MSGIGVPHHVEHEHHKRIGIAIAVIAVIMAIIAALAKNEANIMIMKEVQASNGYAWYQSKRQRSYVNELEIKRLEFELAGSPNEAQRKLLEEQRGKLKAKNAEYESETKGIVIAADADKKTAEMAAHRHHWFEYGEILLHIAVVLCSLTLLTEMNLFYRLGLGATIAGIILAAYAYTLKAHGDGHADSPAAAVTNAAGHH